VRERLRSHFSSVFHRNLEPITRAQLAEFLGLPKETLPGRLRSIA
jgi:hypothetical protein